MNIGRRALIALGIRKDVPLCKVRNMFDEQFPDEHAAIDLCKLRSGPFIGYRRLEGQAAYVFYRPWVIPVLRWIENALVG